MGEATDGLKVETYHLADDGTVPNNALPLVLYRGALQERCLAERHLRAPPLSQHGA